MKESALKALKSLRETAKKMIGLKPIMRGEETCPHYLLVEYCGG